MSGSKFGSAKSLILRCWARRRRPWQQFPALVERSWAWEPFCLASSDLKPKLRRFIERYISMWYVDIFNFWGIARHDFQSRYVIRERACQTQEQRKWKSSWFGGFLATCYFEHVDIVLFRLRVALFRLFTALYSNVYFYFHVGSPFKSTSWWRFCLSLSSREISHIEGIHDILEHSPLLERIVLGPSEATKHWKNTMFRGFSTFSRTLIFFLLTLSSLLWLLPLLLHLSEVWHLKFLRQLYHIQMLCQVMSFPWKNQQISGSTTFAVWGGGQRTELRDPMAAAEGDGEGWGPKHGDFMALQWDIRE